MEGKRSKVRIMMRNLREVEAPHGALSERNILRAGTLSRADIDGWSFGTVVLCIVVEFVSTDSLGGNLIQNGAQDPCINAL